jgi:hypothetical protein
MVAASGRAMDAICMTYFGPARLREPRTSAVPTIHCTKGSSCWAADWR